MKKLILIIIIVICHFSVYGQSSPIMDSLYRNSYTVFELQRLPNGMYRDSKLLSGIDYHPISIANTGMGMISLCIADAMGWINNAQELALKTLKTITGNTPGFSPDRTSNGYYRHFMDINTGDQAWDSEYSTIDTDILLAGALFSMNYFQDNSISAYAMELWNSIDIEAAIANPSTGHIYLSMNANGTGVSNSITTPYNEYMIVAWFAKNSSNASNSVGNVLWNNYYNSPDSLSTISYNGFSVLSDNGSSFLSSFTHQFNYYLCHYFTGSNEYMIYYENAQKADSAWWGGIESSLYEWGLGAGSAITNSYHADAINNNNDLIVSPHIIAGYIPVNPNGKNDLINLWKNANGKYLLPTSNYNPILWRYSKSSPMWIPNEIIGVDYASMLFGLSTLPEYLGENYFLTYNDFFPFPTATGPSDLNSQETIIVYPNPIIDEIIIESDQKHKQVSVCITSISGRTVYHDRFNMTGKMKLPLNINKGLYFITFIFDGTIKTFKIIKQ